MKYNNVTGMYECDYKAYFKVNNFDAAVISKAVNNVLNVFNNTKRTNYKHICVKVNSIHKCLDIHYVSSIDQDRENWLRSCQLFSKLLAKEKEMGDYVVGRSLLYS